MTSTPARRPVRRSVIAIVAVLAAAGCARAVPTHSDMTEDEARVQALLVAADERIRRDSDLYRVPLTIHQLVTRTSESGDEYWEATLVDHHGVPRVCVHVRGGFGGGTTSRRCDPGRRGASIDA